MTFFKGLALYWPEYIWDESLVGNPCLSSRGRDVINIITSICTITAEHKSPQVHQLDCPRKLHKKGSKLYWWHSSHFVQAGSIPTIATIMIILWSTRASTNLVCTGFGSYRNAIRSSAWACFRQSFQSYNFQLTFQLIFCWSVEPVTAYPLQHNPRRFRYVKNSMHVVAKASAERIGRTGSWVW